MKLPLHLILALLAFPLGKGLSISAQTVPQATPAAASGSSAPLPTDQENARKAKELLQQAVQALGGDAYLNIRDMQQEGRTYSFHHGRSTSDGILFWRFTEAPDKERIEVTKQRDITYVYGGEKGYEITYKGAHPVESKDLTEYLRRRHFSLDRALRIWLNDPGVALFYDGNAVAENRPALRVSLINANNEGITLYLDPDTHLPIKKTFAWRDPEDKQRNVEEETYDNYRNVQGIMTPYTTTRYYNGDMANQRFLNAIAYNQGLNPAMFDANSGYVPNKQPPKR
jgi:hypothetical protein